MTTAGPPAPSGEQQRSTKRILSTASSFFFFSVQRSSHWSCRCSQSCASRSRRRNVSSAISQTTTRKNFFFRHSSRVHHYSFPNSVPNNVPFKKNKKKKKKKTFVSCTQFTVPEWLQKCSFFPLFYLSLIKLFLNFCSRYFLRNGMCGQAKLPGPEVKLRKIYSRHPLDFS